MAKENEKKAPAPAPQAKGGEGKQGWQAKPQGEGKGSPSGGAPKPAGRPMDKREMNVPTMVNGKELRGIVRMAGRDLRGHWTVMRSIQSIKGIGINLGHVISRVALSNLSITPKTLIGELDEEQTQKLEQILAHPEKYGVPDYMLNRQREPSTNITHHLIGTDLAYAVKNDIDREKDIYTWRGYRHAYGQKVRGQHTRSTGRTGMTVGVMRKAIMAKAGAAGTPTAAAAQAAGAPAPAAEKKAEKAPSAAQASKAAAPAAKPAEAKK